MNQVLWNESIRRKKMENSKMEKFSQNSHTVVLLFQNIVVILKICVLKFIIIGTVTSD